MSETINPAGDTLAIDDQLPSDGRESDEFTKFEELTSKLLDVPKSELDEAREEREERPT